MKTSQIKLVVFPVLLWLSVSLLVGCQNTYNPKVHQIQTMLEENSFVKLQRLAEAGDGEAQYRLGLMYDLGREVPQDYKKAFEWYEKSANQGIASAKTKLGLMYRYGKGVSVNHNKATQLLFEAYEQGDEEAHYHLGSLYI